MNSLVLLVIEFTALAAVIIVAGMFLTRFADRLGKITGLGSSMSGLILLAIATSLPELAIGCNAALIPAPDLAVGDLLGSSLFNLLILATIDLLYRNSGRMFSRTAAAHSLSAVAGILLTAIVLLFLLIDVPWPFPRVGLGSLSVIVVYFLALRLIYNDQQVGAREAALLEQAPITPGTWTRPAIGFVCAAAVVFVAARAMTYAADELSIETGLGGTLVGTLFVALATSLPEVATTYASVRIGAPDMAVGNILGSNAFNMAILFGVDLFYDGHVLAVASQTHALTAAAVIIVTAVVTMGLLYRAEKRLWVIEPDAVLVILLIAASLLLVYYAGG